MPGKRKTPFVETEDAVQDNGSNEGTRQVSSKGNKVMRYSFETLEKALQLIKDGQVSIGEAARSFGIAKSTLHSKLTGKRPLVTKMGPATYLTVEEENEIKSWILNKAKLGFPLCREDVKDSIQNVLVKCPRETPFVNHRPGEKWMSLFLKRHPEIDEKNTEAISKARATVSRETISVWFQNLKHFVKDKECEDIFEGDGSRVLNCDETGCLTCPKSGKVLGPKGYKNLYEISCGKEKESITVLCTYNAKGDTLPPMVVFPYKRTPQAIMRNLPQGWSLGKSDSGWMVSSVFYEYITKVLFNYLNENNVKFPVILFLDGHKSHLSLQLSNFCAENRIIIYCLPPNATHIVQPCDVSIFRPLKVAWKKVVRHSRQVGLIINRINFVPLFKKACDAVGRDAIKNGFRACGLFPLNEKAIDYTKCISERRAEIERKDNQNETPTTEELSTTRKVIEHYLRDNGRESFLVHLKEGTCPEDENKQMFLLWKKCLPQSLLSNSTFNSLYTNVHSLHSPNSSDPEDPHSVSSLDIMSMPIELQDWDLNLSNSDPYSGLLKEFDLVSDRISDEVEIGGNKSTNNNIPIIDITNQRAFQGGEEEERCDEHSSHLDAMDNNNNSSAICDDVNTGVPVVDNFYKIPEQPDAEAANVVESVCSSSKQRASTSWDEETARLKSLWSEELTLPKPQNGKTLKDKPRTVINRYCITEREWREEQESKQKEREEKEKVKAEKAKQRAENKAEKEKLRKEKLDLKTDKSRKKTNSKKAKEEAKNETEQEAESSTEAHRCPACQELYEDPPAEDWIMCNCCNSWYHEDCTLYLGRGEFTCDNCECGN